MTTDLLMQLEQKVAHAVEIIELLRLQLEELEEENIHLKAQHEKWRSDLTALLKRFDRIETPSQFSKPVVAIKRVTEEEEFLTV